MWARSTRLTGDAKPATRPVWVPGDELDPAEVLAERRHDAFGDTPMQVAHRCGISTRGVREWAAFEDELDVAATLHPPGFEAVMNGYFLQAVDRADVFAGGSRCLPSDVASDFTRCLLGSTHLEQPQRQAPVWARAPPLAGVRREPVLEAASPRAPCRRRRLDEQARVTETREVLPDGVVVQLEVLCELGYVDRTARLLDVLEDRVSGGVAERAGLALCRVTAVGIAHENSFARPTVKF